MFSPHMNFENFLVYISLLAVLFQTLGSLTLCMWHLLSQMFKRTPIQIYSHSVPNFSVLVLCPTNYSHLSLPNFCLCLLSLQMPLCSVWNFFPFARVQQIHPGWNMGLSKGSPFSPRVSAVVQVWKELFHIFCPCFQLFMAGGVKFY